MKDDSVIEDGSGGRRIAAQAPPPVPQLSGPAPVKIGAHSSRSGRENSAPETFAARKAEASRRRYHLPIVLNDGTTGKAAQWCHNNLC